MPMLDKTGPWWGSGPKTGFRKGFCSGIEGVDYKLVDRIFYAKYPEMRGKQIESLKNIDYAKYKKYRDAWIKIYRDLQRGKDISKDMLLSVKQGLSPMTMEEEQKKLKELRKQIESSKREVEKLKEKTIILWYRNAIERLKELRQEIERDRFKLKQLKKDFSLDPKKKMHYLLRAYVQITKKEEERMRILLGIYEALKKKNLKGKAWEEFKRYAEMLKQYEERMKERLKEMVEEYKEKLYNIDEGIGIGPLVVVGIAFITSVIATLGTLAITGNLFSSYEREVEELVLENLHKYNAQTEKKLEKLEENIKEIRDDIK
ncbi:MAG: hypothetical protein ACTSQY_11775, partial [Candidatus Odinarchaeia archaeon]